MSTYTFLVSTNPIEITVDATSHETAQKIACMEARAQLIACGGIESVPLDARMTYASPHSQPGPADAVRDVINEAMQRIAEQREEIIRAFIAKHQLEPDQCEQVVEISPGKVHFYVRRKVEGESREEVRQIA